MTAERYNDATSDFDKVPGTDPLFRAALSSRAQCRVRIGMHDGRPSLIEEAIADWKVAIALASPPATPIFPGDKYDPDNDHYNLAYAYEQLRCFTEADGEYAAYLRLHPKDADTLLCRANLLWRMGKLGDAESAYRDVQARLPHFVEARNNLAELLVVLNRPQEAEAILRATLGDPVGEMLVAPTERWRLLDTLATAHLAMAAQTGSDVFIRDAKSALDAAVSGITLPPTAQPGDGIGSSFALIHLRRGFCHARLGRDIKAGDDFILAYRWSAQYSEVRLAAGRNLAALEAWNLRSWTAPLGAVGAAVASIALMVLIYVCVEFGRRNVDSGAFAAVVIGCFGAMLLGVCLPRLTSFKLGGAEATIGQETVIKTTFELTEIGPPRI